MKIVAFVLPIVIISTFYCNVAEGHEYITKKTESREDHESYLAVSEIYRQTEKYSKNAMNKVFKSVLPYVLEFSEKVNVSQECMKNSLHLIYGIKNIKQWAIAFLDASGKVPDGMIYGSVTSVGHYEQCLDIEVKSTSKKDLGQKLYQGQYCMIEAKSTFTIKKPIPERMHEIPEELKNISKSDSVLALVARNINYLQIGGFRIGVCIPSGCTTEDINSVLQLVGRFTSLIRVSALKCEIKEENNYTPTVIAVFVLYAVICCLVLAGSMVDIRSSKPTTAKSKVTEALLAFSLISNFKKFSSSEQATDCVTCLNGMKFFGLTWVVLGHTFIAGLGPLIHGYLHFFKYPKDFAFQVILNAMFAVDTFFVIGSFLVSYLTTKQILKQKKKFSVLMYIVHRLLRLYPIYIVLLSTIVFIPLISSGPFWKEISSLHLDPCFKNWWANLLFISNIYHPTELCFIHTWYITVDIQLYILSLIFIIPLLRWPKLGLSLICLGIVGHIIYCGIVTYMSEWPPVVLYTLMDVQETLDYLGYVYYSPFTHLGPYGIGLLLGYFYAMNPDFKMSRTMQVLGWCIAFTCSFSVLYGSRGWYLRTMPHYLAAIYSSLAKVAWSIGPAWIILCCATGHGGIINWILSWGVFTHLSRLTFSSYMIHFVPMIILLSGLKVRIQPDLYIFVWYFAGSLCASLLLGFILHMFVEVPFSNLERVFLLKAKKVPEPVEKEKNTFYTESKEEKDCDIFILAPCEKDYCTKL